MVIFFTASIRGLKSYKKNFDVIYKLIKELGHTYAGNYPFKVTVKDIYSANYNKKSQLFHEMDQFIKKCDMVILEVSEHSVSMGYMIMRALSMKKPVVALHIHEKKPAFLIGINDENFQLIEYKLENLKKTLQDAIEYASKTTDIRFNMMLSPKLSTYLKEVSETEGVSKATFIRQLIKKHRDK